jgi:DNA-binding transcriptional ArsR family regulator
MKESARFFQALADETRLKLLAELRQGERTVGDLVAALAVPQPKVSRHLRILKEAGLVSDRKTGRHVLYALCARPGGAEVSTWIDWLAGVARAPGSSLASGSRPRSAGSTPRREDDLETHLL